MLTVTAPAPTPGAVRPQTRYSYTLTDGEYQLTGISQCRTTASCAGTADEVKTALAYDANGKFYWTASGDGTGALVASSTMTYDPIGNLIAEYNDGALVLRLIPGEGTDETTNRPRSRNRTVQQGRPASPHPIARFFRATSAN